MGKEKEGWGVYLGLAKRFLLGEGIMVPVDEAEDVEEEESSSWAGSGDGLQVSHVSSSAFSSSSWGGRGNSKGKAASLALAKERWSSLMLVMDDQSMIIIC